MGKVLRRLCTVVAVLSVPMMIAAPANAATSKGAVHGAVFDPAVVSGGGGGGGKDVPVNGATITLTSTADGKVKARTSSMPDGQWLVPQIVPGTYDAVAVRNASEPTSLGQVVVAA